MACGNLARRLSSVRDSSASQFHENHEIATRCGGQLRMTLSGSICLSPDFVLLNTRTDLENTMLTQYRQSFR